jgi:hypothetical protein
MIGQEQERSAPMIRNLLLVLSLLSLAACASPAERANMSVTPTSLVQPSDPSLVGGIAIGTIDGGQETNPLWTSEVSSEDFRGALSDSLRNHGLLAEGKPPRYLLNGHLLGLQQPLVGLSMTVSSNVNYELIDAATIEPVHGESVGAKYTAQFSDAFAGIKRLRLANEGAIRENIKEYLDRLRRKPAADIPVASAQ